MQESEREKGRERRERGKEREGGGRKGRGEGGKGGKKKKGSARKCCQFSAALSAAAPPPSAQTPLPARAGGEAPAAGALPSPRNGPARSRTDASHAPCAELKGKRGQGKGPRLCAALPAPRCGSRYGSASLGAVFPRDKPGRVCKERKNVPNTSGSPGLPPPKPAGLSPVQRPWAPRGSPGSARTAPRGERGCRAVLGSEVGYFDPFFFFPFPLSLG